MRSDWEYQEVYRFVSLVYKYSIVHPVSISIFNPIQSNSTPISSISANSTPQHPLLPFQVHSIPYHTITINMHNTTCCQTSGSPAGCVCAAQAKCSCGRESALHCTCNRAGTENYLQGAKCSCRMSFFPVPVLFPGGLACALSARSNPSHFEYNANLIG